MKNNNIRFNLSWSSVMALLAFSTLTQADGPVAVSHSRCEPRGPVLTSATGSSQSDRLRDKNAVARRLPIFNPRASAFKWTGSGAVEGQGNPKQTKSHQRPLSSRRIDSEPDGSKTSELAHESVSLDPESFPDWEATQTLTYHWHQYAGTSLCSKVPFQLSVLPGDGDTEPGLIVEDAQLGEHGCFCVAISPTTAKGQAALYFNADEGQLDTHLSTLEVNGKPVPLDQLEPLGGEVPVQGHGLELSAALVEGLEGVPQQTPIRLDASQVKVRETPKGQGEGQKTPPPSDDQAPGGGGGATGGGGTQGGGSGTGGGGFGGSGGGFGGQDPKKPRGAEDGGNIDLELAKLDLGDKNQEELDELLCLAIEKEDENMTELILSHTDSRLTEKLNNISDNIKSVIAILEQDEKKCEEMQEKLKGMLETIKTKKQTDKEVNFFVRERIN